MNNLSKRQQAMIEEKQKVHRRVNTPVDPLIMNASRKKAS
jgi:hypothetical protein